MSIRSQKRKLKDGRHHKAWVVYWRACSKWAAREPSRWRIFAWLKWRNERPHKPKDAVEYAELCEKYCPYW